jgi:Flp pilus assembly protein TadG
MRHFAKICSSRLWLRGGDGSAAIEFGLFMPLLILLLTAVAEIGLAMFGAMQVHNATSAGVLYAAKNGWNQAAIANAVVNASNVSGITATPAPAQFCGCPSLSGITAAACGTTCTGGAPVGQYIRVSARMTRITILPNPWLLPATLTAQSIYRQN